MKFGNLYMSRIGKKEIVVPKGVDVTLTSSNVQVKGPKATLSRALSNRVKVVMTDGIIKTTLVDESLEARAMWGTTVRHMENMITGVTEGFVKKLIIEGVGYRGEVKGKDAVFQLGFSHPVIIPIPESLTVTIEKGLITVSGSDKEVLGKFAATVREKKKPEPYKGKGIRYEGEVIHRKQGKKTA